MEKIQTTIFSWHFFDLCNPFFVSFSSTNFDDLYTAPKTYPIAFQIHKKEKMMKFCAFCFNADFMLLNMFEKIVTKLNGINMDIT